VKKNKMARGSRDNKSGKSVGSFLRSISRLLLFGKQSNIDQNEDEDQEDQEQILLEQVKLVRKLQRNISQDFVSEMREAFILFDKDKSGTICSKELGILLRTLGYNPTEAQVNEMVAEADIDHNGTLELAEFIILMHNKVGRSDQTEEMKMAFRVFDTNGDGTISKEEFKRCMVNFGEKFTDEDVDEMVASADIDNDGLIDYNEFVHMMSSLPD